MENVQYVNTKHKAGMAILSSNKIGFETKITTRDKKKHFQIKRSIHQKDKTIINVYESNESVSVYMNPNQTELRGIRANPQS